MTVRLDDFSAFDGWRKSLEEAAAAGAVIVIPFPSHVPELFEAATGAYGRFRDVCVALAAAAQGGADILIEQAITMANLKYLPDFVRFVDTDLTGVTKVRFTWDASGEALPLEEVIPWWHGCVTACLERGIAFEGPQELQNPRPESSRVAPGAERARRSGGTAEVALVHRPTGPDAAARAVKGLLAELGGLERLVRPASRHVPAEVVCELSSGPGTDGSISLAEYRLLFNSIRTLGRTKILLVGEAGCDPLARQDLADIIKAAAAAGLVPTLTPGGCGPEREAVLGLKTAGLAGLVLRLDRAGLDAPTLLRPSGYEGQAAHSSQGPSFAPPPRGEARCAAPASGAWADAAHGAGLSLAVHSVLGTDATAPGFLEALAGLVSSLRPSEWLVSTALGQAGPNMLAVTGDQKCKRQNAKCKVQSGQASWLSATIDHRPSTITYDRRSRRFCLETPGGFPDGPVQEALCEKLLSLVAARNPPFRLVPLCLPSFSRTLARRMEADPDGAAGLKDLARERGCPGGISRAWISADGRLAPCPHLRIPGLDLRKAGWDFASLWSEAPEFRTMRLPVDIKGRCGYCEYRNSCFGCRAAAAAAAGTGGFRDEDPLCSHVPRRNRRDRHWVLVKTSLNGRAGPLPHGRGSDTPGPRPPSSCITPLAESDSLNVSPDLLGGVLEAYVEAGTLPLLAVGFSDDTAGTQEALARLRHVAESRSLPFLPIDRRAAREIRADAMDRASARASLDRLDMDQMVTVAKLGREPFSGMAENLFCLLPPTRAGELLDTLARTRPREGAMSSAQLEECAFGHLESAGLTTILGTTPDGRAIDLVETAPSGLMLLDAAEAGFLVGGPDFVAIDCAAMAALGLSDSELPLRRAAEALGYHGAVPEGLRIKGIAAENPRTPVAARPPAAQATGDAEATVVLDEARCRQHRVCAEVCPTGTVECGMRNGLPRRSPVRSRAECGTGGTKHHAARCILCCECVEHCPEGARAPVAAPGAVTEPVALATKPAGWLAALTQPASTGSAGLGPWTRPPAWQRPRKLGKPLTILGLSMTTQQHHAAALLRDGRVVGAVEEERLRRLKQYGWFPPGRPGVTVVADPSIPLEEAFPWRAVNWLLREAGLTLDDIDIFAVNGIPGRFSRSYSRTDPSRPPKPLRSGRFLFIPHHLSHAASAVRFGGMRDGFAFTVDGRGERETAAFFEVEDGIIRQVFDVLVNEDSLIGGVYETITQILGFGKFGQGSTMGLAALGRPGFDMARCLAAASHLDTRIHQEAAFREFSHLKRGRDGAMTDEHIRLAASVQDALEKLAIGLLEEGLAGRRAHTLALAGGVALNCRMNQSIRHRFGIEKMVMQPAMHDAGTALGAALEAHWMLTGEYPSPEDAHAYHGPGYSDDHIRSVLEASRVPWTRSDDIALDTARLVADGQVVCWFQGRLEFGPRALGTRSILADPRSRTLKDRINILKGRQWWRPFGPSILEGHEADYFVHPIVSPFMLFTLPVRKDKWDEIPAVLHVDQTTRPQSVNERTNPLYYATIREFQKLTGIPMVLNTSFNTASEPIVCSPEGALSSFLQLGADYLAIGDYLVERVAIDHPPSHDASAGLRRPSAFARRFGGTSATIVRDGCSGQSRLDSPPSARSVEQAPVGSQRLMLRLTTRCNNRCEHCTIADIAHFPEKEAAAALAEITRARRDGCTELVFMRGEAPLRRDLLPLVTRARAMGYRHIQVQTNGRLFAYEKAVRAFLEAGVSFFEVSLYGDCAGLHDAVAQVQGAFEQTAAGLRNLAHANASLLVTVPIVKRNFTRLSDIVDCAKALGANRVQLNFPRPVRVENRWIHAPLVRLAEASPFVRKALDKAFELGMEAGTEAIPLCHLAPEQRESAGECGDFGRFQAVDVHRRTESLGAAREQSRPRTTSCSSCPLVSSCPTTWKAYQDLFGTRELNPRGT